MRRIIPILCTIVVAASCGDYSNPLAPGDGTEVNASRLNGTQAYNCDVLWTPGCPQQDPNPALDGLFLNLSSDDCDPSYSDQNDSDQDGLTDVCEYQVANAFRPLFRSSNTDDTGGEFYWAARLDDEGYVRIFYALGYYKDWGVSPTLAGQCDVAFDLTFVFKPLVSQTHCEGHDGDSEFVVARVYYDGASQHWILDQVFTSAHFQTGLDASAWTPASGFAPFPGKINGYPRIWVSFNKHANYKSKSHCEGTVYLLGQRDDCSYTSVKEVRPVVTMSNNLGSRSYPLADNHSLNSPASNYSCMVSVGRFAGNERQECFWATGTFYGWHPTPYLGATGYSSELAYMGF
jgi:hypothetical protein